MLSYLFFPVVFSIILFSNNLKREYMPTPPNIQDFLNKIEAIESSGGKNTNHPVVTADNIQKGTRGIGRYALMPNTVKELINRRRINGTMTGDLDDLDKKTPEEMKAYIEANPDIEDSFANQLANHVIRNQNGNEDKAAYSWKMGSNLTPDAVSNDDIQNSDYVQKFQRLGNLVNKGQQNQDDEQ
jgi:hypothetical protein